MSWWIALGGGLSLLVTLLLLGLPVFVAFLILNITGILLILGTAGFGMFANSIFTTGTTNALIAVPLFILMGEILFRSGAIEIIVDSLDRLVGNIRGRQYVLCILLSAVLGALSGAAMAVAALLGRTFLPVMLSRGYDPRLSAGAILAGASLNPIIPPSVLAILISAIAQVSTGQMLIAGIVPGIMLTIGFIAYLVITVRLNPELAPSTAQPETVDTAKSTKALLRMFPALFIFFLVMGLIMLGIATPTESAAAGVFGALVLTFAYGRLSFKLIQECLISAVHVAALVLLVMCCAVIFSQLLALTGAPRQIGTLVASLQLPDWMMLFIMMLLPFILFLLLDPIAILMVLIPIYHPVLAVYQFNEIWFYTLILIVATAGGLTPPFGYTIFALKGAAPELLMSDLFKGALPFVIIMIVALMLFSAFPSIITFLPDLMHTSH